MYYKIKKKQELVKNGEVSPEAEPKVPRIQNDEVVHTKEPEKDPEKEPGPSIWGEHLNKQKFDQETTKPKASTISSSVSYSKLTEKLMKGAKINIRSSLTRRLTNKSISSPANKLNDSQMNSSQLSEACDNSLLNNSLPTPTDESPPPLPVMKSVNASEKTFNEPKESEEVIQGFKPKIIQHQATHKQPFSLSMARQRVATRQVDLQWLDECLVDGGCNTSTSNKPSNVDEDVIYSTDDESPKPPSKLAAKPVAQVAYPPSVIPKPVCEDIAPPPTVNKRKLHEDEIPATSKKRQKMDETVVLQEKGESQEFVDSKEDNDSDCSDSNRKLDVGVRNSTKENSTLAAKRERLEKYY